VRVDHPFIATPSCKAYPIANTIARPLRNTRPLTDPAFVCHPPYNIRNNNIVLTPSWGLPCLTQPDPGLTLTLTREAQEQRWVNPRGTVAHLGNRGGCVHVNTGNISIDYPSECERNNPDSLDAQLGNQGCCVCIHTAKKNHWRNTLHVTRPPHRVVCYAECVPLDTPRTASRIHSHGEYIASN